MNHVDASAPDDERAFWSALEFRVSAELEGDPIGARRRMWCDGLLPGAESLEGPTPTVSGDAWICFGNEQQRWRFTALVPSTKVKNGRLVTDGLLPDRERTDWVRVDLDAREIELDMR
jgi:hypothetical protein